jgi:Secretion system C-terminal sorting domain
MKKQLYFIFTLLLLAISQCLWAQVENDPCSAPCISFSGTTSGALPVADGFSPNVNLPCGSGTSEDNPTWYTFVPSGTTFSINLSANGCVGGSESMQVSFFEGDDCGGVSSMACLNCITDGSLSIATTPGRQYWIQMDGCGEATCNFTFTYNPLSLLSNLSVPTIKGNVVVNKNEQQTYEASFDNGMKPSEWIWSVTPTATIKTQNDNDGTITFVFPKEGNYTVCAKPKFNVKCLPIGGVTTPCLNINVGKLSNYIRGEVFLDKNKDCKRQVGEPSLLDRIVEINGLYYVKTVSNGYFAALSPGNYTLITKPKSPFESICLPPLINLKDSAIVDIPLITTLCPYLNVDISTSILRRCVNNKYFVSYCNNGSEIAKNAYVTVALDTNMTYINSSIPLTKQVGNLLTFNIADVKVGECSNFNITTFLNCNTPMNLTHCVEAHIYPDSICLPTPSNYSGAKVEVKASCGKDSVILTIKNTGKNAMLSSKKYWIVEDEVEYQKGTFKLNANDSLVIAAPKNGSTYRIEAEQEDNYPFIKSNPSAWVEACGVNSLGVVSSGVVNKYSKDDDSPFTAVYCRQNVASYDPNEKIAFPTGVSTQHFIKQNTDIEYELHFQNEGKDTAFLVELRDNLDPSLDINTIQVGSSSAPYRWDVSGKDLLTFTFEKINLTTKKADEEKSQGHVKFRISQKPNVPLGTVIKNRAGIYFDINPVILTNEVFHTVGKDFIKTVTVAVKNPDYPQVGLKVYPNPFEDKITFELEALENKANEKVSLSLFSIDGKLVAQAFFQNTQVQLLRNNLPKGLYFYQIKMGNKNIQNGKVVAE